MSNILSPLLLASLFASAPAFGQTAGFTGRVLDPSGAVVARAGTDPRIMQVGLKIYF